MQPAQPFNVGTVLIDGRFLEHKGELVALDAQKIVRKAAEYLPQRAKGAGGP